MPRKEKSGRLPLLGRAAREGLVAWSGGGGGSCRKAGLLLPLSRELRDSFVCELPMLNYEWGQVEQQVSQKCIMHATTVML